MEKVGDCGWVIWMPNHVKIHGWDLWKSSLNLILLGSSMSLHNVLQHRIDFRKTIFALISYGLGSDNEKFTCIIIAEDWRVLKWFSGLYQRISTGEHQGVRFRVERISLVFFDKSSGVTEALEREQLITEKSKRERLIFGKTLLSKPKWRQYEWLQMQTSRSKCGSKGEPDYITSSWRGLDRNQALSPAIAF